MAFDSESQAFVEMLTKVRTRHKYDDAKTNAGLVINPIITSTYPKNTSIKLMVRFDRCLTKENAVTFTCDVSTTIGESYAVWPDGFFKKSPVFRLKSPDMSPKK